MSLRIEVKAVMIGNSMRMTIPKPICKTLGIKAGDTLSVGLTNGSMIVEKAQE